MFEVLFPQFICILVPGKHSEKGEEKTKTSPRGFKVQPIWSVFWNIFKTSVTSKSLLPLTELIELELWWGWKSSKMTSWALSVLITNWEPVVIYHERTASSRSSSP